MNMTQYTREAMRMAAETLGLRDELALCGLGLTGEAGEIADTIKKHLYHDHPLDRLKVLEELGDLLWYVARCSLAVGASLDDVAINNIAKLRCRYPGGFSPERSLHRIGITERELEEERSRLTAELDKLSAKEQYDPRIGGVYYDDDALDELHKAIGLKETGDQWDHTDQGR